MHCVIDRWLYSTVPFIVSLSVKYERAMTVCLHWIVIRTVLASSLLVTVSKYKVPVNFLATLTSSLRYLNSWGHKSLSMLVNNLIKSMHLVPRLYSWASNRVLSLSDTAHLQWTWHHVAGNRRQSSGQICCQLSLKRFFVPTKSTR